MLLVSVCAVLMNLAPLFGQGMTVVGSGYASPTTIRVSPGQITTSFPLSTSCDANDASVVTFLKGGLKKELEVETAAFLTKWLMDRDVPFGVDFDSSGVDRALVIESLPKRLQKALGATAPVIAEAVDIPQVGEGAQVAETGAAGQVAEIPEPGAAEEVAAVEEVGAGLPGEDGDMDGSSELR
jgi:hypothetical protein